MKIDFRLFKVVRVENELHERVKKAQQALQQKTGIPLTADAVASQLISDGLEKFYDLHGVRV